MWDAPRRTSSTAAVFPRLASTAPPKTFRKRSSSITALSAVEQTAGQPRRKTVGDTVRLIYQRRVDKFCLPHSLLESPALKILNPYFTAKLVNFF